MRSVVARTALASIAVLLIAWFAVLLRGERIASEAQSRIFDDPEMSDADWQRSMDRLREAELLNPGTEWTVTRANLLLLRDKPEALRVAESVLRRERDNLAAWVVVDRATRGRDPRRASLARREIERLNKLPRGP
jgi:hypothetical protein